MQFIIPYDGALWPLLMALLSIWLMSTVVLFVYRITFHPLARFPGPKLPAMSYANEFWFDVVRGGRYTHEILRMHEKYGPIVRINPNELHCNDPTFVDVVYALDHDHHRRRNAAMSKCFSRSRIRQIEHLIHVNAQKLCDKVLARQNSAPFAIVQAYSCFTADIISHYCFGDSDCYLDQDDWEPNFRTLVDNFERNLHIFRHIPGLATLVERIPLILTNLFSTEMKTIAINFKVSIPRRVRRAMDLSFVSVGEVPTILSALLSSNLPPSEKTLRRLTGEAVSLMGGGTESTSATLVLLTFHLLSNPNHHKRLYDEISAITTNPLQLPDWKALEKLNFFSAVILECLRLLPGVSGRSPRIATHEDLIYEGKLFSGADSLAPSFSYTVPRGFPISMSTYILHTNETIFPNAKDFVPDRWLDENGNVNRELERYLLSFSKGSRQCIGRHLALCELYVCAAAMILRVFPFLKLYQTSRVDVDYDHDELIGKPSPQSNGVRVQVLDKFREPDVKS
ncbi:unnamed protein product [Clonostachys byssicola]|uniref:Cytochrome P450 n=1 Tax=Clonostachys byssicola TaxID=160290 RepID=A0A9N9UWD8_9HYPO|nr:unnamed protein product [Clonostachys byssicola]